MKFLFLCFGRFIRFRIRKITALFRTKGYKMRFSAIIEVEGLVWNDSLNLGKNLAI